MWFMIGFAIGWIIAVAIVVVALLWAISRQ